MPEADLRSIKSREPGQTRLGPAAGPLDGTPELGGTAVGTSQRVEASLSHLATAPVDRTAPVTAARMIASGVFVTGSAGLIVGSRYGIQVGGARLRILGPVHLDPATIALEHELRGITASGENGRLVVNAGPGSRSGLLLVFMSLNGGSIESAVAEIVNAARGEAVDL